MANIFLISDTHFSHSNIVKFESKINIGRRIRHEWDNVDDMNEDLIQRWNSVVRVNDYVYHLGDFCLGKKSNIFITQRLNGKKQLVMGNHEHFKARDYLDAGFEDVMGCKELDKHILTHIPLHESQKYRYRANIHGHTHEINIDDPWYINVSCEQINYTPIPFEDVRVRWDANKKR